MVEGAGAEVEVCERERQTQSGARAANRRPGLLLQLAMHLLFLLESALHYLERVFLPLNFHVCGVKLLRCHLKRLRQCQEALVVLAFIVVRKRGSPSLDAKIIMRRLGFLPTQSLDRSLRLGLLHRPHTLLLLLLLLLLLRRLADSPMRRLRRRCTVLGRGQKTAEARHFPSSLPDARHPCAVATGCSYRRQRERLSAVALIA
jgi:hypothetical protein